MEKLCLALVLAVAGCSSSSASGEDPPNSYDGTEPTSDASVTVDGSVEDAIDFGPEVPNPRVSFDAPPSTDSGTPDVGPKDTGVVDTGFDAGGLTCTDTTYDVDGLDGNACEVTDAMTNHTEASAIKAGLVGECDAYKIYDGTLASDARVHLPSGDVGSRPVYYSWFHATSTCSGNKPILFLTLDAVGSYEIALYVAGGSPDPACSQTVTGKTSIGPVSCSPAGASVKMFWRLRKLSGPPEVAKFQLKFR